MAEGPYSVLGRVNYPCTILLFNVHVGRFPGFVVLHHLRLQEERDEGDAGRELYISYLLEGGEGQELYILYFLESSGGQELYIIFT